MRATTRILVVGLSPLLFAGCAGSRCLHRPCDSACAGSFNSPSPFAATSKSTRPSFLDRYRISRLWDRDETPRDITVRPEETPIPGEHVVRRPPVQGALDLPPITASDDEPD